MSTATKFTNKKGIGKINARKKIVDAISDSTNKLKEIVTLAAQDTEIEKMIYKTISKRFKYIMCERNIDEYIKMCQKANSFFKTIPPSFHFGTIGEVIMKMKADSVSHIIADYCGQFATFKDEIAYAMKNNVVEVDGTISITINKRISPGESARFFNEMNRLNPMRETIQNDTMTEHAVLTFLNRNGGNNFAIETIFNYRDSASMLLIILRRIK